MRGRRGGAELEEEDEEILVCFVVQSLCLFPSKFVLHCPLHLCVQLLLPGIWRPILSFPPFSPQHLFVVQSLFAVFTLTFSF